ncbi:hypothetical protein QTO34_013311 [Cnephaeus nilssonii]|uniref:Large ribosomal subunit protein uL6 n=1 Tax=Cnephaeus nilssonii TaxID=3371016 RepID=A0AA40I7R7_CNENI|nr:hypothetical protein QTO34_013311 [Eptesicus nilssonii]
MDMMMVLSALVRDMVMSELELGMFRTGLCGAQPAGSTYIHRVQDEDHSQQTVDIPENVDVTLQGRTVIVQGLTGTLRRDFSHIGIELSLPGKKKKRLHVDKWWGNRRELATVHTTCSHVQNMIKENDSFVEIRNFLGEKYKVWMRWAVPFTAAGRRSVHAHA